MQQEDTKEGLVREEENRRDSIGRARPKEKRQDRDGKTKTQKDVTTNLDKPSEKWSKVWWTLPEDSDSPTTTQESCGSGGRTTTSKANRQNEKVCNRKTPRRVSPKKRKTAEIPVEEPDRKRSDRSGVKRQDGLNEPQ
ncbi:hypothetical protein NDU88_005970 [Pleurodeles waltl]|uniref:Uncharacterized protein n=1 Tax=Pleurodeles waltl TaxID=8319 RepID=A0AAV7LQL3_PLEWA|nr:hypothetical protein NDU88_005970 [Pleurodeles waltl]